MFFIERRDDMKDKIVCEIVVALLLVSASSLMFAIQPVAASGEGDVNGDGIVDISDVVVWAGAFGSQPGDPNWNADTDLRLDDLIDIFDVIIISINYGNTYP